jgi:hypothetical protein
MLHDSRLSTAIAAIRKSANTNHGGRSLFFGSLDWFEFVVFEGVGVIEFDIAVFKENLLPKISA